MYGCDCHMLLPDDKHDVTWLLVLDWTYAEFQTFQNQPSLKLGLLGELIVIITGKAEAFIYISPSYNNAKQCNMLGEKLSQLNDKA